MVEKCDVCGIDRKVYKYKCGPFLCGRHRRQMNVYGKILSYTRKTPNEIVYYNDYAEIILTDKFGKEIARAKFDIDDIEKIKQYKWVFLTSGTVRGYAVCFIRKSDKKYCQYDTVHLHRIIMNTYGTKQITDHINRDKLDNRKCNLRLCDNQQNIRNVSIGKNNKSGKTGVCFVKERKKWKAGIMVDWTIIQLGFFNKKDDAIEARRKAENFYYGNFAPIGGDV